jgi:hypothetical protein
MQSCINRKGNIMAKQVSGFGALAAKLDGRKYTATSTTYTEENSTRPVRMGHRMRTVVSITEKKSGRTVACAEAKVSNEDRPDQERGEYIAFGRAFKQLQRL